MLLTADWLRNHNACPPQVSLFRKMFPIGLRIEGPCPDKVVTKVLDSDLEFFWFDTAFEGDLSETYWAVLERAQEAYNVKVQPILTAYRKKLGEIHATHTVGTLEWAEAWQEACGACLQDQRHHRRKRNEECIRALWDELASWDSN